MQVLHKNLKFLFVLRVTSGDTVCICLFCGGDQFNAFCISKNVQAKTILDETLGGTLAAGLHNLGKTSEAASQLGPQHFQAWGSTGDSLEEPTM